MRFVTRLIVLLAAFACSAAFAQTSTRTYPGLNWSFTTSVPGFSGCATLTLDATGGSTSGQYSIYGFLFCPSFNGSYLSDGNAFFDTAGRFNMQMRLGVASTMLCTGLNGFSGNCAIYDSNGIQLGTAFINLR